MPRSERCAPSVTVLRDPAPTVEPQNLVDGTPDRPLWPYLVIGASPSGPRWLTAYDKFLTVLLKAASLVAVLAFVLIMAIVVAGVVFRYVLNDPLTWSETLALWAMVWLVFAGTPVPLANSSHYVVEALVVKLPRGVQVWLALAVTALGLLFSVLLAVHGFWLTNQNRFQIDPTLEIPFAFSYAAVPVGFTLMAAILLRNCLVLLTQLRVGRSL